MDGKTISAGILLISLGLLIPVLLLTIILLYYKKALLSEREKNTAAEKERRALIELMIPVVEKERERIAKNIHDDIGSILSILKLNFSKILKDHKENKNTEELIRESIVLLDQTIQNARGISHDLTPSFLNKLGFKKALAEFCRQIGESRKLSIEIQVEEEDIQISSGTELQLFRIMQEILNNIIKHAAAENICIAIQNSAALRRTEINIIHDGQGISQEKVEQLSGESTNVGLKSILGRIELINGTVLYSTTNNKVSGIKICIPISYEKTNQAGNS